MRVKIGKAADLEKGLVKDSRSKRHIHPKIWSESDTFVSHSPTHMHTHTRPLTHSSPSH